MTSEQLRNPMTDHEPGPGLDAARDRGHARANHDLNQLLDAARGMAEQHGPERAWSALAINLADMYGLKLDQLATGVLAAAVLRLDPTVQAGTADVTARPGFVPTHESLTWNELEAATGGPHRYLSTACFHGRHDYCAAPAREDGMPKVPSSCKFCSAPCECPCGQEAS